MLSEFLEIIGAESDVVLGELQTIPDVLSTETIMVLDEQPILPRRY